MNYKDSELLAKAKTIVAPDTKQEPTIIEVHGDKRIDNYYWMKLSDAQKMDKNPDQQTQEVVAYLEAENEYKKKMTSHLEGFEEKLFEEMKGRIKQDDSSVPYLDNGYYYISRYEKGTEYPIFSRKKGSLEAEEEIMLDVNVMAEGYEYYNVSGLMVSPNNKIVAYGVDNISRRQYTINFKNLETGEMYPDKIVNTTGACTWANDNKTIFYTRKDESLRSYKVFRHTLGTDVSEDVEVYHEEDDTFNAFVYKTKSDKYIVFGSWATLSQEYWILDANDPNGKPTLFQKRERNLEYSIYHYEDNWYVRTNKDGAYNFKVMSCPEDKTSKENWVDLIPHDDKVFNEDIDIFKNFMVLEERREGISTLRVRPWKDPKSEYIVPFDEEAYTASTGTNLEFDTNILRLAYSSMTTPTSVFDFDMNTKEKTLMKQQAVLGDFKIEDYESERIMVPARDGVKVPMSIVYKKGFKKDGTQPILLYGYGSYGNSMDPYFSSVRLSLLDRGFAFAIAHIRGGQEMGRMWYENGKFLKKKNTFTDFIDCGQYLVDNNYTNSNKLFAMGGSAGGLLMGAIINMEPNLFTGIVAAVPFVDVVTTMLDDTIPLTTGEYDEWGNPNDKEYYDYIKSYSPYDNIESKDYPSMLVTTGYHDSQVQYWEPAKWVAKLRDMKTDQNPLILHTNMGAGHGGASGRFNRIKEIAMEYAFILDIAGLAE